MGRYKVDYEAGELIPLEEVMIGASSSIAGIGGIVPPPAPHYQYRLLGGDGTWQKGNFIGTKKEWNSLTKEEKLQFETADIYKKKCTITYKANNGIDNNDIVDIILEGKYTTRTNNYTLPTEMMFWYWNTEPDGSGITYEANETIIVDDDLTLYAFWDLAAIKFDNEGQSFSIYFGQQRGEGIVEYTINHGTTWTRYYGEQIFSSGSPLYMRGLNNTKIKDTSHITVEHPFTGKYCTGNIETLLDYQKVRNNELITIGEGCFYGLFCNASNMIIAPKIPTTMTLALECYCRMFENCTSLISTFKLPATTLAESCYAKMFHGCTSLTTAPELPATTLANANSCYESMFHGCTSLTTAPKLPATTLAERCYISMFNSCSSLIVAPELPATTLANQCYASMFSNCMSLTTAPSELPATTLVNKCYNGMFWGCTSLIIAPKILAKTATGESWCNSMFWGCTLLTTIPKLSITALMYECYYAMFYNCTSVKISATQTDVYKYPYRIPALDTGTTAQMALNSMFSGTTGSFTGTPTINTTYYTDHEPV